MKVPSLALALALATALVATAQAQGVVPPSQPIPPSQQTASQPSAAATGNAALRDYNENVNPNVKLPTTDPYDEANRYSGPDGRPLPGRGSLKGEGAGDS